MRVSVSRSSFYIIWKTRFKNLKIKQTNSFSRCSTCTTLTTRIEKTRDGKEREELKKKILAHNNRQMAERNYYKNKRKSAENNKRQFMSLIIDGMDQSKTNLPHFTGRRSKAIDAANLLQTHVQGIINHGLNRFATYVDINEYKHDSNMVMNTLLKEIYFTSVHMNSFLPDVLYIQADNCFRENKNRYMLAFCELLVRTNVFKEVHLSFLYVGHTHEDIDAAFSRVSEKLRKTEAETLVGLIDMLPNSKQTGGLYDIKGWLEKHINPIKGHTVPLHFKFSLDATGKICVQYKGNNHRPWKQLKNTLLKKIPPGIPSISVPDNFNKKFNFDALEKNIERSKYLFSDILQNTQYRWWKRYITFLRETSENENKQILYAKKDARWLLPILPKSTLHSQEEYLLPQEIQEMVDREIDDPEVEMPEEKKKKKTNPNSQVRRKPTSKKGPSDSSGKKKTPKKSCKDKTRNSAAKANKNWGKKPTLQQRKNLSKSKRSGKTKAAQRKTNANAKHSDKKKRQKRTRSIVHSYVYYYQRTAGGDKLRNFLELLLIFELIIFFCGYCIAMHLSVVELLSVFNELIRLHLEMTLHSPIKSVIIGEINGLVAQCAKPANSMVMLRSLVSGCSA